MDAFWRAMIKTNARMVAVLCVACLVAVVLFIVWESTGERRLQTVNTPEPVDLTLPGERIEPDWGALASQDADGNPFQSVYLDDILRRETELAVSNAAPPEVVQTSGVASVVAELPSIRLLYRGMMKGPDGRVIGMVENPDSNAVAFYECGSTVLVLTVTGITRDELRLRDADGAERLLAVGVVAEIGRSVAGEENDE